MSSAVEIYLPDADHARRMGWKYHLQWSDDGRPCFYRRKTIEEARRDFNKLSAEGHSPFVVDCFTGETVNLASGLGAA